MGYILVSVASGILFGILDGVINANPLAQLAAIDLALRPFYTGIGQGKAERWKTLPRC